jgi:hypothetical protein
VKKREKNASFWLVSAQNRDHFRSFATRFHLLQPAGCVLDRSKKAPETAHFQASMQAMFRVEHNKNT